MFQKNLVIKYLIYPTILILCLIVKIIRPLIFIRFGCLYADKIGPFASNNELILCEKDLIAQPKNCFDIYCESSQGHVCNNQLLQMWRRKFRVWKNSYFFWYICRRIPFLNSHLISSFKGSRDIKGLLARTKPHLEFLHHEKKIATQEMKKFGIGNDDNFILIMNRGSKFLNQFFPSKKDLSYNDFRNCEIKDFLLAAENLTKKKNFIIRMGKGVDDKINSNNPRIIDYELEGFRSDLLDIYLSAKCRYIICSDTGFAAVPCWLFRKPLVSVNFCQIEHLHPWLPNWLFIFRKYWVKNEKRFMKIEEIIKSGVGKLNHKDEYEKKGIELVKNSPTEILDASEEMESRLNGTWKTEEEDDLLQKKFWSHFKNSALHGNFKSKIGTKFLRENRNILL